MKALILTEPKKIEIADIDSGFKLKPNEVLIEVNRISLCGSDYKLFNGDYSGPSIYPLRFGHEWSGKVLEVGPQVIRIKKGDRVTGDCSIWCGNCQNCAVDKNLCQNIENYGITKDGFSQQLKVVPEKYLYPAPSSISYSVLALAEPFAVALHAIHRLGNKPEQPSKGKTLIIGCGSIGIAIYMLLRYHYGWDNLEIYDVLPERVALLHKILPQEKAGYSFSQKDILRKKEDYDSLYAFTDYALIFEAAGKLEALQMAIDLVKPRGVIISLGMFPPQVLDFKKITMKALSVIGSIGGTGDFPEILGFFEKKLNQIKALVTAKYAYTEVYKAFREGQDQINNIKVQIQFANGGD